MKNYRRAFLVALLFNILLAAGLGYVWWSSHHRPQIPAQKPQTAGRESSGETTHQTAANPPSTPSEAPLAPVQLTPQRMQSIGVQTGVVEIRNVADEIRTVGSVEVDETKLAYVQVRFPGWIQKVFADATYQYIRKGQPLFTIYSPDLVTTEREYLLAKENRNELAHSSVAGVAGGADSLLSAASERLKQWQVPDREIANLESTGTVRQELEVDSPVTGYITERNALPNMYVQPETKLYAVANLSTVWIYAEVFQSDTSRLGIGQRAAVTTDAYPGQTFSGRIDYLWPQVDMNTRTQRVRLVFSNPQMKLKPGISSTYSLRSRWAGTWQFRLRECYRQASGRLRSWITVAVIWNRARFNSAAASGTTLLSKRDSKPERGSSPQRISSSTPKANCRRLWAPLRLHRLVPVRLAR